MQNILQWMPMDRILCLTTNENMIYLRSMCETEFILIITRIDMKNCASLSQSPRKKTARKFT